MKAFHLRENIITNLANISLLEVDNKNSRMWNAFKDSNKNIFDVIDVVLLSLLLTLNILRIFFLSFLLLTSNK